ncbi:MAG: acyl carrier protein [Richelia sp. RM1_1_1]|nr:acyl carrier protein [Richelia sp. RM1_1_1]
MVLINEELFSPVLFDDFCNAVAKRLQINKDVLRPEASWVDDVGISSIDIVKIVMLIRQKFHVKISTTQAGKIKTVQDAYQLLLSGVNNY